jgi:hypothetical protein
MTNYKSKSIIYSTLLKNGHEVFILNILKYCCFASVFPLLIFISSLFLAGLAQPRIKTKNDEGVSWLLLRCKAII